MYEKYTRHLKSKKKLFKSAPRGQKVTYKPIDLKHFIFIFFKIK